VELDSVLCPDLAGLPFTDPLADGPTIQESNDVSLVNGTNIPKSLEMLRQARKSGVNIPIILMGYYNPLLIYGEERVVSAAKEAGANGFIVVDLPPEEAVSFRSYCRGAGYNSSVSFIANCFADSVTYPLLLQRLRSRVCSLWHPSQIRLYTLSLEWE
jgi:tryptophan synthase